MRAGAGERVTIDALRDACAEWQRILRLNDWDIDLSIVRRHTLTSSSSLGQTTLGIYRRATIKIADPTDFLADDTARDRDLEDTLVHELLHLHFNDLRVPVSRPTDPSTAEEVAQERAIEAIAGALLTLKRQVAA